MDQIQVHVVQAQVSQRLLTRERDVFLVVISIPELRSNLLTAGGTGQDTVCIRIMRARLGERVCCTMMLSLTHRSLLVQIPSTSALLIPSPTSSTQK